jgi:hypothetical protein
MQSTINKPIRKANPGDATGVGSDAVSESDLAAEDPIAVDGLQWLDDQLPPELKDMEHRNFLIADTFNITSAFLLDILQDEESQLVVSTVQGSDPKARQAESGRGTAVAHQPQDDEWSMF